MSNTPYVRLAVVLAPILAVREDCHTLNDRGIGKHQWANECTTDRKLDKMMRRLSEELRSHSHLLSIVRFRFTHLVDLLIDKIIERSNFG
ncbi:unnamed protein product [Toxocara canis]|uniref:Secreted protein n=1 Tax=Toxocara canis TaxID=6265 RepID=A0A183UJ71_TOXCA|nr:unnamed protein product [Toxocara canis]